MIKAVDFITVHIYPYWEGADVQYALESIQYNYDNLLKKANGKKIIIGEVGWPSDGNNVGVAEPSLVNQRKFFNDFLTWACDNKIDFYYFEAFDELWKANTNEGPQGAHWGLLDTGRIGKHAVQTVLFCPKADSTQDSLKIINIKDNITTNIEKLPLIIEFIGDYRDTLSKYHLEFPYENLIEIVKFGKRERIYCDAILSPNFNLLKVKYSYNKNLDSTFVNVYFDSLYKFYNKKIAYLTAGNSILVSDVEKQSALGRVNLPFNDSNKLHTIYYFNNNSIIIVGSKGISRLNTLTNKIIDSIQIITGVFADIDPKNNIIYFTSLDSLKRAQLVELDLNNSNIRIVTIDSLGIRQENVENFLCRLAINDSMLLIGWDSYAALFNRKTFKVIKVYQCGTDGYLGSISFSPTRNQFVVSNASWGRGDIILWDRVKELSYNYKMSSNFAEEVLFSHTGDTLFAISSGPHIGMGATIESISVTDTLTKLFWSNKGLFTGNFNTIDNQLLCSIAKRHDFGSNIFKFGLSLAEYSTKSGEKLTEFPIGYNDVQPLIYGWKEEAITDLIILKTEPNDVFDSFKNRRLTSSEIFQIFPNPANNFVKINIKFDNLNIISLQIINNLGINVYENILFTDSNEKEIQIDTKIFSAGVYFCIIKSGYYIETKKLIIIK